MHLLESANMSWFNIAKSALSQAQRSIDKVLDIEQEDSDNNQERSGQVPTPSKSSEVFHCLFSYLWVWESTRHSLSPLCTP